VYANEANMVQGKELTPRSSNALSATVVIRLLDSDLNHVIESLMHSEENKQHTEARLIISTHVRHKRDDIAVQRPARRCEPDQMTRFHHTKTMIVVVSSSERYYNFRIYRHMNIMFQDDEHTW
jgi:hypothetical protein